MKVYRNIALSRQKFYHNLPSGGMVRHTALEGLQREVHILQVGYSTVDAQISFFAQKLGVHPTIVALRDVFYNPDRQKTYLVMHRSRVRSRHLSLQVLDCCPGGSVQRWNPTERKYEPIIADYTLMRSDVGCGIRTRIFINLRKYIVGTLEGLQFIHSRHVVHRDIKPENLLVDSAGRVRISSLS